MSSSYNISYSSQNAYASTHPSSSVPFPVKPDFDADVAAICIIRHIQGRPVAGTPLSNQSAESSKKKKSSSQPQFSTLVNCNRVLKRDRAKFSRSNVKQDIENTRGASLLNGLTLSRYWNIDTNINNKDTISRNAALTRIEQSASCEETAPLGIVSMAEHLSDDPNATIEIWHDPECGHTWNFYKKQGEEAVNYDSWLDGPALPASDASSSRHKDHSYQMFSGTVGESQDIVQSSYGIQAAYENELRHSADVIQSKNDTYINEVAPFFNESRHELTHLPSKVYPNSLPVFSEQFQNKTKSAIKKVGYNDQVNLARQMVSAFNVAPEHVEEATSQTMNMVNRFASKKVKNSSWKLE